MLPPLFLSWLLASLVPAFVRSKRIDIFVGNAGTPPELAFIPVNPTGLTANFTAQVGDVISFGFNGGNHSVTQSTFDNPCQPMPGGFDSGWVLVNEVVQEFTLFNLTITDTSQPIWFYCKQLSPGTPHCSDGMVAAINAPATGPQSFDNFKAKAKLDLHPGQAIGQISGKGAFATAVPGPLFELGAILYGTPSGGSSSGSVTPTPTTGSGTRTTPSPTQSIAPTNVPSTVTTEKSTQHTPAGAIVGGVLGALALLALIVFALLYMKRRKKKQARISLMGGESGWTEPVSIPQKSSLPPPLPSKGGMNPLLVPIRNSSAVSGSSTSNSSPQDPDGRYMNMKEAQRQVVAMNRSTASDLSASTSPTGSAPRVVYIHSDSGVIIGDDPGAQHLPPSYADLR